MTTEIMETWSLEEGDQILVNGEVYRIIEIGADINRNYLLFTVDEEGYRRHILLGEFDKVSVLVLDNLAEV